MIHRAHISCDYQLELYVLHRCLIRLTTLLSFANLTLISFDRHYALSKPLRYRADASNSGKTSFIHRTILHFNLEYLSLFIGICYNTAIVSIFHIAQLIANGEVSIDKYSSRRSRGECSPMLTEPKANNCFSIIFRGEC